ncbi:MAG: exodeoxyribonuclease VII small subunit [Parachlamydiaceae bacterium]|nr:exodeoxyribonuclease VII small subunit [Parachlamydiaceae bacterium]
MKKEEPSNSEDTQSEKNFEAAFARLEEILERMNSGSISLDESLKLYQEADELVNLCSKRLNDAERKIEILIKNRGGELALNADNKPMTQDFMPPQGAGKK